MKATSFLRFFGLLLVLSACSKKLSLDKKSFSEKASSPLNSLSTPLGFGAFITSEKDKTEVEKLNATYFFLVAQRKGNEGHNEEALVALERAKALDKDSAFLHWALAQEYLRKGLSAEGVAYAQRALELEPQNRDAKLLLGNLYATAKKYTEARKLFTELLEKDPDDEEVVLYWVLLEIEQKHFDIGYNRLKNYLARNPESALGHFYMGRLLQENKKNREAMRSFERAVDIRPVFVQAGTYLASLYEDLGEKKKATETYAWLALQTDGAPFHKKLGELYLLNHEYEKALGAFQNFERLDSSDLNNKVKVALLLTELKRYPEALNVFQAILKEAPESDNIRFYFASVFDQEGNHSRAMTEYARIPFKSKLYPEALRYRVNSHRKRNESAAGDKILLDAAAEADREKLHEDEIREIRLTHWDNTGRSEEALREINALLKKSPQDERFLYLKGAVLEHAGKVDEAVAVMRRILLKDPKHAGALNFIGYVWAERGQNLEQAESFIRKALTFRPQDPFITDSLGWVLFKRGKYAQALETLMKARTLRPDESVIAEHIGDVLVKMGRIIEAKEYYEKALKLGPDKESDKKKLDAKLQSLGTLSSMADSSDGLRVPRQPGSSSKSP